MSQPKFTSIKRRHMLGGLLSLPSFAACNQTAAQQNSQPEKKLTAEEQRWKHKFRGLSGGELFVDATGEKIGVNIFNEKGQRFYASGALSYRTNSRHGYGSEYGVPITLRAEWRDRYESKTAEDRLKKENIDGAYAGGTILGNVTVPVAERIPDDVLDRVRKYHGVFVLKLRLTDETLLVGWEVKNRRGYPFKRDKLGYSYETSEDRMQGGDFCESQVRDQLVNGNLELVRLKGWYIDKATGKRTETDF
jgi:hypothetical protein